MSHEGASSRYEELDALRGVAAMAVVLFHFTMGKPEAELGFKWGTTGVDLFFIISGFVIFMSLLKVNSSRDFIINRVSRLYPTYWACVIITFAVILFSCLNNEEKIPFGQFLGNLTMFQYYFRIKNLDGAYWTMIIEMIFYIGILFLYHFKILKNIKIIGIVLTVGIATLVTFFPGPLVQKVLGYIPLMQFIALFFSGIIFYEIYTTKKSLGLNYTILIICLICQIGMFHNSGRSNLFISQTEYAIILTIYFLIFTLFVNGKLKFIVSKTTLFFGKISFALYLIHQKISVAFILPFLIVDCELNFWIASMVITLPLMIGLAAFITFYIEAPMSKKLKEKLRSLKPSKNIVNLKD
jgi:peptidoglycan/LPS O-acetylase OafA/YrhL